MAIEELYDNTREFLKMNLLIMSSNEGGVAGKYNFGFVNATSEINARCDRKSKYFWKGNHDITVWFSERGVGSIPAFYVPWQTNTIQKCLIPPDVDLVLTGNMDGCTFGVAQFKSGNILMCHANFQTSQGGVDTVRTSRETRFCQYKVEPHRYLEQIRGKAVSSGVRSSLNATVVARKYPGRGWTIYVQQYEMVERGMIYKYHDLMEISTNSH